MAAVWLGLFGHWLASLAGSRASLPSSLLMPEGDTIHHAAARIRAVVQGHAPQELLTPHPRHAPLRWDERLAGQRVRSVDAHGKHLFIRFEGGLTLHSHLRMSGLWSVRPEGERWRRARSRAWLLMRREGWEVVQFDGPVLELMPDSRTRTDLRLASLGQDILGAEFDGEAFLRRLRADDPSRPIGDALLDQRTVAGIGNVWKCECCFGVGIDPWRATGRVSDEEALALIRFAREGMQISAREGPRARPRGVYRRAGERCRRCGSVIRSGGQWEDARTTYWCPGCQA